MSAFTVKYIPKGTREISPKTIITKGSTEIVISIHPFMTVITKFEIKRNNVVVRTYDGLFEPGKSYKFQDLTAEIGQTYSYQVKSSTFSSPSTSITIPCSTICCPQKFEYGRWNNTSTNLKLFPSILKNQKYYGNNSSNQPIFINPPRVNNNIFTNTSYQMKKGELYKYLSTNRAYLRR